MPTSTIRVLAANLTLQFATALAFASPSARPAPPGEVDHIVVTKSTHTLVLYSRGAVLRTYQVALGRASGPKEQQGDNRTPEGHYTIVSHNPHSAAHMSLHISYPNADDRTHRRTGGDIMIHGLPNGYGYLGARHLASDWTYGCIAVTDEEIEEIYRLVPNGTPIDIEP